MSIHTLSFPLLLCTSHWVGRWSTSYWIFAFFMQQTHSKDMALGLRCHLGELSHFCWNLTFRHAWESLSMLRVGVRKEIMPEPPLLGLWLCTLKLEDYEYLTTWQKYLFTNLAIISTVNPFNKNPHKEKWVNSRSKAWKSTLYPWKLVSKRWTKSTNFCFPGGVYLSSATRWWWEHWVWWLGRRSGIRQKSLWPLAYIFICCIIWNWFFNFL